MAAYSSVLAWRIPGTAEPGGLPAVYGVTQARTRLKQLSSSSSSKAQLGLIGSMGGPPPYSQKWPWGLSLPWTMRRDWATSAFTGQSHV